VFGLIIVALALTLAATKPSADYLTPRKNPDVKTAKKAAHGKGSNNERATRLGRFRHVQRHADPDESGGSGGRPAGPPPQPPEKQPENIA